MHFTTRRSRNQTLLLQMEPIKRFLHRYVDKPKPTDRLQISLPVEGSFKKHTPPDTLTLTTKWPSRKSVSPTMSFTPEARGREETLAYLNTESSDSLTSLLTERDKASEQIKLGPHTKGTIEVQQILKEPSPHTLQQLHDLQKQTMMEVRYGTPGIAIYNFSESLGWNQAAGKKLPPLQLRPRETRKKEFQFATSMVSPSQFSPINWLVLPRQTTPEPQPSRSPTPISEPGGWRDTKEEQDTTDSLIKLFLGTPLGDREAANDSDEEADENMEGEFGIGVASTSSERRAIAVKMTPILSNQIRQVSISN